MDFARKDFSKVQMDDLMTNVYEACVFFDDDMMSNVY